MTELLQQLPTRRPGGGKVAGVRVGRIVAVTPDGWPYVDFPGNGNAPLRARTVIDAIPDPGPGKPRPTVLLVFENDDPELPIIIGVVADRLTDRSVGSDGRAEGEGRLEARLPRKPMDAIVDGRRIRLEAKEEILLQCGRASLLLRKDGKVVIKGTKLISRSSGSNKIRGASVDIN